MFDANIDAINMTLKKGNKKVTKVMLPDANIDAISETLKNVVIKGNRSKVTTQGCLTKEWLQFIIKSRTVGEWEVQSL